MAATAGLKPTVLMGLAMPPSFLLVALMAPMVMSLQMLPMLRMLGLDRKLAVRRPYWSAVRLMGRLEAVAVQPRWRQQWRLLQRQTALRHGRVLRARTSTCLLPVCARFAEPPTPRRMWQRRPHQLRKRHRCIGRAPSARTRTRPARQRVRFVARLIQRLRSVLLGRRRRGGGRATSTRLLWTRHLRKSASQPSYTRSRPKCWSNSGVMLCQRCCVLLARP
mmetsp:Transcript_11520/g.40226  ORF Transcript_11520/g.40226 Transcript_11520/m.40226 type:complete len:221 (+) Transcript_11520:1683-2345(+)